MWSSGTTGGPKGSPITRDLQAGRIAVRRTARGLGHRTRYLTGVPFSAAPGYIMTLATLAAGGAVILRGPDTDFVGLANTFGATVTSGPPGLLASLVNAGERPPRLETLEVFMVSGTHLPSQLARAARLILTPNLWIGYGATETDSVANAEAALALDDPSATGFLFPWVDAQIVDGSDRPLAAGQEGVLRLRCAQMIAGYYANAAATQRNFRDGWFYPGDLAIVTPDRLLRITGRIEDVIVRDGVAIAPRPLEEAIRPLAGVRDVAVFPMLNADGSQDICAALVLEDGADAATIQSGIVARLGAQAPTRIFRVEALPLNPNGKVVRRELVDWAMRRTPGQPP